VKEVVNAKYAELANNGYPYTILRNEQEFSNFAGQQNGVSGGDDTDYGFLEHLTVSYAIDIVSREAHITSATLCKHIWSRPLEDVCTMLSDVA
jgi:hypothetical protein